MSRPKRVRDIQAKENLDRDLMDFCEPISKKKKEKLLLQEVNLARHCLKPKSLSMEKAL